MKKLLVATSILFATTALVAPAMAVDSTADLTRQMQVLQEQLRQMQEKLKANEQATKDAITQETKAREASEKIMREYAIETGANVVFSEGQRKLAVGSNPKIVQSGTNRFTLSSADNAWTIAPTGRIHFDFGGYLNQRPEGTTGPGTVAGGRLTGGVNARRARLGVTGRAMNDFTYSIILDAGGATDGPATINQLQIAYTGIRNTLLEAGYFPSYFTMDETTSSNDIMFIERASPANIAAAFNAADVRWALTWQGRFLDAMTTWEERAATPARPLGDAITALPEWRALARLSSADAPWPLLNAEGVAYRYKGFSVGSDGIPTFHYEVGPLRVDDTLRPDGRSGGYRRTVALRGGTPGWYFRGATAGSVPREVIFNPAGEATLEEILP